MKLAETQAALWPAITQGKVEGIEQLVQASRRLNPEQRVDIYSQMYFWRQVDALKEDFPKLAALLGEDGFGQLVHRYVMTHPSEHFSLGRLGRKLAEFLSEQPQDHGRPDLADLASLEWARAEVFVERDAPLATEAALADLRPHEFARARLKLIPAVRLLRLGHDVISLWRAIENSEAPPDPAARERDVLVWRKQWTAYHVAVASDEAQALRWAQQGRTLGEVCEAFSYREQPVDAAFRALRSWFAESVVTGVEPG
jgi:hypothetical protein